jgi:cyclase
MLEFRVIPCLLLKDNALVKSVKFKNYIYIGDPINAVRIYNQKEVDEIIILDIISSKKNQSINFKLLEDIASECFMPLTYGGGVRTLDDFKKLFYLGVEKVAVNTLLFENPGIVEQAVNLFGSQAIVASIDVKKAFLRNAYKIWRHSKNKALSVSPLEMLKQIEKLGVGEILLTSVDRDGTWSGYDIKIIEQITVAANIPVISCGGAGNIEHLIEAKKRGKASALAIGSMAVLQKKDHGVLIRFPSKYELELINE